MRTEVREGTDLHTEQRSHRRKRIRSPSDSQIPLFLQPAVWPAPRRILSELNVDPLPSLAPLLRFEIRELFVSRSVNSSYIRELDHDSRRATIGSTRLARQAGPAAAPRAAAVKITTTPASVAVRLASTITTDDNH